MTYKQYRVYFILAGKEYQVGHILQEPYEARKQARQLRGQLRRKKLNAHVEEITINRVVDE